jgi:hypothetical protein
MFDVLLFLAIPRRLLECLDDEGGCGGDDADLSLTVLDGKLHGHAKTLPVTGRLGDYEAVVREPI